MQQQLKTVSKKTKRFKLLNVKVTQWEDDRISDLADKHAGGNKSEWLRYAALNFKPRKQDLAPIDSDDPNSPLALADKSRI